MRKALRLLPLPVCIAFSLAAHAADDRPADWRLCPVQDAIPAFPDAQPATHLTSEERAGQPTDIEGDEISGPESNRRITGNVALRRGDQFLGTDQLTFDTGTGHYFATGSVRYQDAGMRLVADEAEGNQGEDRHDIRNVRYQLVSRRGNGGAEHIELQGSLGSLYGATYSTCPPEDRSWELRAQRIDVDTAEGMGVAHNAVLRIGKVPVLYVPWFPFPVDDRRRTGLLYPGIGSSSRNGFDYRQPIYLNLAPNYDLTLQPRFMTRRGFQLGAEFRYLVDGGVGNLDFSYLPSDDLSSREREEETAEFLAKGYSLDNRRGDDRARFHFDARQALFPGWEGRAELNWISDPRVLEDSSNNVDGLAPYSLNSVIGVFGRGRHWSAGLAADHHQLADYTLDSQALPHDRLPRAWLDWEQPLTPWLHAGLNAEAVRFHHEAAPGGSRLDVKPFASMPLQGASWFLTPKISWRYTSYRLDDALAAQLGDDAPSRSLPIASLDGGLFFDRATSIGGESFLQTLEPRMFYLRVPYRDQDDLPRFDTRPLTFSWGQLFRENRYTGADRQTDANQLTLAVSTRLLRQSDGREKLSASLGQIRYFDESRVIVPGETPVERGKSAWVADASYAVNDRWSLGASYQWDPKFRRKDLASVRTRYLVGDTGVVNLSYRYRRDVLEQVDLNFLYPLSPSWSLVGRYYHSIEDNQLLEGIAGVQWDSCCMAVRLVGRRYLHNREGELSNSIQFEVELKGLGSAGPDTESRLRRAILGYYREDLYLVPPSNDDGADDSPELMP
ncbi:MAG: LPS-assembly protein LptD [Lysobacteraceae bacterium]|nr:MAG: LPS-assembly protein LptD [Xanthomonadaceae bacterium]